MNPENTKLEKKTYMPDTEEQILPNFIMENTQIRQSEAGGREEKAIAACLLCLQQLSLKFWKKFENIS